jgi:alcohol dehydrogenase class IV
MFALKAIELISQNIRKAYARGDHNLEARYAMCLAAFLAILPLRSIGGLALIHAAGNPPATKYHLSHGKALSLMMPYVMQYNLIANREKYAAVAFAMGEKVEGLSTSDAAKIAIEAVKKLISDLDLPTKLREVGAKKEDFPEFARNVMKRSPHLIANEPRNVTEQDLLRIYESAW